jgi:hypothetical protein
MCVFIFFLLVTVAATSTAMVVQELTKNQNAANWAAAAVVTGLGSIIFAMAAQKKKEK